jgi:hypothetical protein
MKDDAQLHGLAPLYPIFDFSEKFSTISPLKTTFQQKKGLLQN